MRRRGFKGGGRMTVALRSWITAAGARELAEEFGLQATRGTRGDGLEATAACGASI